MRWVRLPFEVWWLVAITVCLGGGCDGPDTGAPDDQAPAKPTVAELPAFELREDTPNLLLTWVDEGGDFHVVRKPDEVPEGSREKIRVVSTEHREGTGSLVYVADLRSKRSDGTYRVSTVPRSAWDEVGASRRKSRMEALAPKAMPDGGAPPGSEQPQRASLGTVVIYGAKWCGACREAARFLEQRGVKHLEKDVDESPLVQRELQAKLKQAGLPPTSSIPILDIGGKLIVGFNAAAVDKALRDTASQSRL